MIVPALPGSRTSAQSTTSSPPRTASSGRSTYRHTATRPWGLTAPDSAAAVRSSTSWTGTSRPSSSARCSSAAAVVTKTSTTQPGRVAASASAFQPSARKSRRSVRTERRLSFRASLTRALLAARKVMSGVDRGVDVLGQGSLGHLDQGHERGVVVDGQVRKDLPVDLDTSQGQTLDEAVVGQAVLTSTGVDPLDPELAELALLLAAVVVAVDQRVGDLLLGLAVQARTLTAVAGGPLEDYPALLLGVYRPLDACHLVLLLQIRVGLRDRAASWRGERPPWRPRRCPRGDASAWRTSSPGCGACQPSGAGSCPTRSPGSACSLRSASCSSASVFLLLRLRSRDRGSLNAYVLSSGRRVRFARL